jgi:hypothetical protein
VADGLNNYVKGLFGLHIPYHFTVWVEAFNEATLINHRHSSRVFAIEFDDHVLGIGGE